MDKSKIGWIKGRQDREKEDRMDERKIGRTKKNRND